MTASSKSIRGKRVFRSLPAAILCLSAAFVALDGIYVEGLLHVSELGNDYFRFDAVRHQLLGERTSRCFRLGDRVRVKVARVDLDSSRIDFVLA